MPAIVRCRYCGASTDMPPLEALRLMRGCMNCKIDIRVQGQWTGNGYQIYQWAKAKFEAAAINTERKVRE